MSENGDKIELEGEVIEALRGRMFRIQLDNGHQTLGYLAGRLKRYRIRHARRPRTDRALRTTWNRGRIVYRLG